MRLAATVQGEQVLPKRQRINVWAKQKLIEELLELPYGGKDLRLNAYGADTNYLNEFIRRRPDRRRDDLIRESRKRMDQEKPFVAPAQGNQIVLEPQSVLEQFMLKDYRTPKGVKQLEQQDHMASTPWLSNHRDIDSTAKDDAISLPLKTFPKLESGRPTMYIPKENQVEQLQQPPLPTHKPNGSIRKLIDLTEFKKKKQKEKTKVPTNTQGRISYNSRDEDRGTERQQQFITEKTDEEDSANRSLQQEHEPSRMSSINSVTGHKLPQISNIEPSHHQSMDDSMISQIDSRSNLQVSELDALIADKKEEQALPVIDPQLVEQAKRKEAAAVNQELRGILSKNNEQHTPTDNINVSASNKSFEVVRNYMNEESAVKHGLAEQLGEEPQPVHVKPEQVIDWRELPDYIEDKKFIEFNDLSDYHSNSEVRQNSAADVHQVRKVTEEQVPPAPTIEQRQQNLDDFEAYESSSESSGIQHRKLQEVKEEDESDRQNEDINNDLDSNQYSDAKTFLKKPNQLPSKLFQESDEGNREHSHVHHNLSIPSSRQKGTSQEQFVKHQLINKPSVTEEKPLSNSFVDKLSQKKLSSIDEPSYHQPSFAEESPIDIEHMMVQDAKQDVSNLYRKMSQGFDKPAEQKSEQDMEKLFEGLNDELNISELRQDIDRLKQKIAGDHSGLL